MFGLFGKSREQKKENEKKKRDEDWRNEQYFDAQEILVAGMRSSDGSRMAKGVKQMTALMERYPDFPKPFVSMTAFSIRARRLNMAAALCDICESRFKNEEDVRSEINEWRAAIKEYADESVDKDEDFGTWVYKFSNE